MGMLGHSNCLSGVKLKAKVKAQLHDLQGCQPAKGKDAEEVNENGNKLKMNVKHNSNNKSSSSRNRKSAKV